MDETFKTYLQNLLNNFTGRLLDDRTKNEINSLLRSEIVKLLSTSSEYEYNKLINNISFDIEQNKIVPLNFFTALLMEGIYSPESIEENRYENDFCIYYWKEEALFYKQKSTQEIREERIDRLLK
jgi:hypothetical protein